VLDFDANFPLAAGTRGQMPARLQLESGWDQDITSELGKDNGKSQSSGGGTCCKSTADRLVPQNENLSSGSNRLIDSLRRRLQTWCKTCQRSPTTISAWREHPVAARKLRTLKPTKWRLSKSLCGCPCLSSTRKSYRSIMA